MRVLCVWFPSPHFPITAWLESVFYAFGFPGIVFLRVADEILFSYNAVALWSVLSVDLFIISFLQFRVFCHGWQLPCWSRMLCFGWKTIRRLRAPIASLVPISATTNRGEPGTIPSTRIPQICTGSFLKSSSQGFWKRDDSPKQKLKREIGVPQQQWGTLGHMMALGAWWKKTDFLQLVLTACNLRSTSLMEKAKAWVSHGKTKSEI